MIGPNNQILCDGTYWYEYDEEGSRTEKYQWLDTNADEIVQDDERFDLTTYTWDHRGRLVKITTLPDGQESSQIAKYNYDYQNRRVEKKIESYDSDGKKVKTAEKYTYVDDDIVLQTNKKGELTNRYLHGEMVDQCLADERLFDDNIIYPLFDNQGTIRDMIDYNRETNESENVNHRTYDAYGNIVDETNPDVELLYGYTGRETDEESDLMFYRARYYDTALGQFVSEDPIGFEAGDFNVRRYVGNSPTNATDPTGMGEGHHWTPIAVIEELYNDGILTVEEYRYMAGRRSGPLNEAHYWYKEYDGINHEQYSDAVKTQLTKWKEAKNGSSHKIKDVVSRIRDGKSWNGTSNPTLKAYNTALKKDMVLPVGVGNSYDINTFEETQRRGISSLKRRGKLVKAMAVAGIALGAIGNSADAAEIGLIIRDGEGMKAALAAIENEDVSLFKRALIGGGGGERFLLKLSGN